MKSILLIGLGDFGLHLARQLNDMGHEVLAIDQNEERVNEALPFVTNAQIADAANADYLKSLGIKNFDACLVTISNFQDSLVTTSYLKELGATRVVSKATSEIHASFLRRNGADEILYPEKQLAKWAAIRYTSNQLVDYIELDDDHSLMEVAVPAEWINKSVAQTNVRRNYGITILGYKINGDATVGIHPDVILRDDMTLLVVGKTENVQQCFKL